MVEAKRTEVAGAGVKPAHNYRVETSQKVKHLMKSFHIRSTRVHYEGDMVVFDDEEGMTLALHSSYIQSVNRCDGRRKEAA